MLCIQDSTPDPLNHSLWAEPWEHEFSKASAAVHQPGLGSVWGLVFHHLILLVRRRSKPRSVPGSHGTVVPGAQRLPVTYWHRPSEKSDPPREGEVAVLALCGGLVDGKLWMTSGVPCRDGGEGAGLRSVGLDEHCPTILCGCRLPVLIFLCQGLGHFAARSLYPRIPSTAGCFLHTFPFEMTYALGKEMPWLGW